MSQKQELGKGIKALLGTIKKENQSASTEQTNSSSGIAMIPIEFIKANNQQPRNQFNPEELKELAQSIKNLGLIQPITIRRLGKDDYQIISGERRYRACQFAGITEIPAYVRTANDSEMLEMALVENIQRVDLNPMEIAITYQRLLEEFNITQEQLAERVGKQRSTISNYARLLKLPPEIQSAVKSNQLSMGHARVLVGIENLIVQQQLFHKTLSEHLSVRALEKLAHDYSIQSEANKIQNKTTPTSTQNASVKHLEDKLSSILGSKAQIKRNHQGQGHIIIKFQSDHELNEILERLDII